MRTVGKIELAAALRAQAGAILGTEHDQRQRRSDQLPHEVVEIERLADQNVVFGERVELAGERIEAFPHVEIEPDHCRLKAPTASPFEIDPDRPHEFEALPAWPNEQIDAGRFAGAELCARGRCQPFSDGQLPAGMQNGRDIKKFSRHRSRRGVPFRPWGLSTRNVVAMWRVEERTMNPLSGLRYGNEIAAAAQAHQLDPTLLAAVAAQETGGPGSNQGRNIVGDGGHGHGLFQIDDRSWSFAQSPAAMDPAANADEAATILSDDLARYGGNVREALSTYNSGSPNAQGTTTTWGDGRTLGYADSVLRHQGQIRALLGAPAPATANAQAEPAQTAPIPGLVSGLPLPPLGASAPPPPLEAPSFAPSSSDFAPTSWRALTTSSQQAETDGDKQLASLVDASDDAGDGFDS